MPHGRPMAGRAGGAARAAAAPGRVRSRPSTSHGQVRQQPGQPGHVVAGVEDHHDVRVAVTPVPGARSAASMTSRTWRGGHRGHVVIRAQPDRVQQPRSTTSGPVPARRPASTASPGSSARCPSPAVDMAEQPAPGWWPRPAAASCSHRPPAAAARPARGSGSPASAQRSRRPRSRRVQRVIQRAMAAPVPRRQRQSRQRPAPARPRTAPRRPARTARPPAR